MRSISLYLSSLIFRGLLEAHELALLPGKGDDPYEAIQQPATGLVGDTQWCDPKWLTLHSSGGSYPPPDDLHLRLGLPGQHRCDLTERPPAHFMQSEGFPPSYDTSSAGFHLHSDQQQLNGSLQPPARLTNTQFPQDTTFAASPGGYGQQFDIGQVHTYPQSGLQYVPQFSASSQHRPMGAYGRDGLMTQESSTENSNFRQDWFAPIANDGTGGFPADQERQSQGSSAYRDNTFFQSGDGFQALRSSNPDRFFESPLATHSVEDRIKFPDEFTLYRYYDPHRNRYRLPPTIPDDPSLFWFANFLRDHFAIGLDIDQAPAHNILRRSAKMQLIYKTAETWGKKQMESLSLRTFDPRKLRLLDLDRLTQKLSCSKPSIRRVYALAYEILPRLLPIFLNDVRLVRVAFPVDHNMTIEDLQHNAYEFLEKRWEEMVEGLASEVSRSGGSSEDLFEQLGVTKMRWDLLQHKPRSVTLLEHTQRGGEIGQTSRGKERIEVEEEPEGREKIRSKSGSLELRKTESYYENSLNEIRYFLGCWLEATFPDFHSKIIQKSRGFKGTFVAFLNHLILNLEG